jgi:predicted dehydrogenase
MKFRSQRPVRYAVVGLGHLAQVTVLPAFRNAAHSRLVALISDDAEKRKKLSRKYGVERTCSYDKYEECLSQGVDAVYIALPNHLHREFAVGGKLGNPSRRASKRRSMNPLGPGK